MALHLTSQPLLYKLRKQLHLIHGVTPDFHLPPISNNPGPAPWPITDHRCLSHPLASLFFILNFLFGEILPIISTKKQVNVFPQGKYIVFWTWIYSNNQGHSTVEKMRLGHGNTIITSRLKNLITAITSAIIRTNLFHRCSATLNATINWFKTKQKPQCDFR